MSLRYLTFDCYGTLIDWRKGIEENFKKFAKFKNSKGIDIFGEYVEIESKQEQDYITYKQILASSFLDLAHNLDLDPSQEVAQAFAISITSWPSFADTVPVLRSLGGKGLKRIILSNVDRELLENTITLNKLEVDGYITAEDVKSYKPQRGHWLQLLKQYGLTKDEVVHVAGSIYHDIVPAAKLGFRTIWVNRYNEPEPTEVKPTHSVRNLSEILNII